MVVVVPVWPVAMIVIVALVEDVSMVDDRPGTRSE